MRGRTRALLSWAIVKRASSSALGRFLSPGMIPARTSGSAYAANRFFIFMTRRM
jgi:hypothetical protein